MQCAIDNAKRTFAVDLVSEIDRITKDMGVKEKGYPSFWKIVKDKKAKVGDKKFSMSKINKSLVCPMNYLADLKFERFRSGDITLPMSYFFQKFELEEDRRKSVKVEKLIDEYNLYLFENTVVNKFNDYSDFGSSEDWSLLQWDFEDLIESIKTTYISKDYIGVMSWLIDRAFLISPTIKSNKDGIQGNTSKNRSLLIKVLYEINHKNLLSIFSKNLQ